jgi:hypothetical protein
MGRGTHGLPRGGFLTRILCRISKRVCRVIAEVCAIPTSRLEDAYYHDNYRASLSARQVLVGPTVLSGRLIFT